MGFISRKLFPACESMCVCCPALRSSSRHPVKRYKKLIAEIFPKSPDSQPSERKLVKLCAYAAKNPVRIPKITKLLEERFYKELRNGQMKIVNIVLEAYYKLLSMCEKQMAYFAGSLLALTDELLDHSKKISVQMAGCQTLTRFVYSQTDGTYAHNIESFVHRVCMLARESKEEHGKRSLRASCLQCLSAMMWYMAEFSHTFDGIDEIVHVTLENYEEDVHSESERAEQHHHWVDEVVRSEARVGAGVVDTGACCASVRPPPERKNIASLTREEIENPRVWAQICLQRMAELAKESTTMRQVLEPMFVYFDMGRHWSPQQGLSVMVLCDISYFVEVPGKQMLILNGVIRHMDHKNVAHDPILKSCVVQVAANLARQNRSGGATLGDVGCVSDLLRHLRKSLQATATPIGEEETKLNVQLQNSIESCLLEIVKGIKDARSLFDLMEISLEKVPPVGVVARATMGSVLILAHVSVAVHSHLQQVFPEALLLQLLKAMLHPDTEVRVVAHQIFSLLLFPSYSRTYETRRWQSSVTSTSTSVTALLEKLLKDKDSSRAGQHGNGGSDDSRGRELLEDESKQGWTRKNSPNFYKLSSIIDRTAGTNSFPEEPCMMKLSEDQIMQLLSGFWIQANLSDNLPSNFEAIAHSYCLTLISLHIKNSNHSVVVRFFQLPLSLRNMSLFTNSGMLPPACRRSIFVISTAMLMFAARMYHMHELNDILSSQACHVDPYLGISEDLQVYVKPQADIRHYGSALDNQAAISFLSKLQYNNCECDNALLEIMSRYLCCAIKIEEEELLNQLAETFSPDDAFMFAPKALRELDHSQILGNLKESSSLDGELSISSVVEDDVTSAVSFMNVSGQRVPPSPSSSHIMSIGQLLESALEVAGQVVGSSVSTSPLPYSTMAGHCEALETGTRKKLSNWLSHDNNASAGSAILLPSNAQASINNVNPFLGNAAPRDQPCSALRLPPASPFDNFLRAVSGPNHVFANLDGNVVA